MDQRGQAWTWTAVAVVDATDNSSDVLLLTHEEKCFLQEDLLPSVRLYCTYESAGPVMTGEARSG